ncbi:MAG: 3-oxoacyl-[acyl-carrier-protein] synthase III C-terminal domain-containing protein, partial [Planctomycetota bacterium]
QMVHIPDTTSLMGYSLVDSGLQIMLERGVPDVIEANLDEILFPFLERNGRTIDQLEHLVFHPGSIKILARTEALLAPHGKDLAHSHEVLAQHGNMSSATVLYILERVLDSNTAAGDLGLMLSFGPGFCGQTLLLEWR